MSDSVRPLRRQPTRLSHPWDSPGKNIGVGCHFLLQCMKVKSESEVSQSYPTLYDPMDCSPPGSSALGIFQARILEWGAIAFSIIPCSFPQIPSLFVPLLNSPQLPSMRMPSNPAGNPDATVSGFFLNRSFKTFLYFPTFSKLSWFALMSC